MFQPRRSCRPEAKCGYRAPIPSPTRVPTGCSEVRIGVRNRPMKFAESRLEVSRKSQSVQIVGGYKCGYLAVETDVSPVFSSDVNPWGATNCLNLKRFVASRSRPKKFILSHLAGPRNQACTHDEFTLPPRGLNSSEIRITIPFPAQISRSMFAVTPGGERRTTAPGDRCGGRLSGTRLFRIRSILRGKTGLLVAAKQYGPGYLAYTHNSP
jgi:hypothetical protein